MEDRKQKAHHIRTNASKRLRTNLRILSIVYIILFFVTAYQVVVSEAIFWQVLLAVVIGLCIGAVSARMYKISWDEDAAEVVGRMDIYGGVFLVLFIIFELNRTLIATSFSSAASIGAISLVLLTSALFGRIFATSRYILQALRKASIIN